VTSRTRAFEPSTNRVLVMQIVRICTAAALLAVPAIAGDFESWLVPLAVAYAVAVGIVEILRRRAPKTGEALARWMILVDGVVLVIAVARTGTYGSPLLFLVFVQIVAATLLLEHRAGLELATWSALVLLVARAAANAGIVDPFPGENDRRALVTAATFLVFATATVLCAWVNEHALRHSRAQLERLVELGRELQQAHRAEDAMSVFVRHVCGRLGFARAVVLSKRDGVWWGVCDDGLVESLVESTNESSPSPALEALHSTAPLLVRTLEDGLLDGVLPNARNVVIVPIVAEDRAFGLVAAEWGGTRDARIPVLTVQALAQAALHTASALQTATLLHEVERLATRDSLTGIANRRLFDESLSRETARAQRLSTPLSLVAFDVDHFKQINDAYGHLVGDTVLREVADSIVASTKSFDVAARYGGDEFMLLLPGCSGADAAGVAERVRAEIGRRVLAVPVTVSAGLATMPDNALDSERLVSAADAALYDAKRDGRDRSVRSTRESGAPLPTVVRLADTPLARGA
jgi:diguanylate cyclase (GGDEF)-like protein